MSDVDNLVLPMLQRIQAELTGMARSLDTVRDDLCMMDRRQHRRDQRDPQQQRGKRDGEAGQRDQKAKKRQNIGRSDAGFHHGPTMAARFAKFHAPRCKK